MLYDDDESDFLPAGGGTPKLASIFGLKVPEEVPEGLFSSN
jgi:hypothetical protein